MHLCESVMEKPVLEEGVSVPSRSPSCVERWNMSGGEKNAFFMFSEARVLNKCAAKGVRAKSGRGPRLNTTCLVELLMHKLPLICTRSQKCRGRN